MKRRAAAPPKEKTENVRKRDGNGDYGPIIYQMNNESVGFYLIVEVMDCILD